MLDNDAIAGIVRSRLSRTSGFLDSKLSQERQELYAYRDGLLPKPLNPRNSKYISTDVADTTEMMEAQLLETFAGAFQPVTFMPQGPDDVEPARIDTETVNFVAMRQNDGFGMMQALIQDGLMGRMGVAKVWWEQAEEQEELEWEGEDGDTAALTAFMSAHPDAELTGVEMDPETATPTSATLKSTTDTSQVRIEVIPPEEYGVSRGAKSPQDADLQFHRRPMTRAEVLATWPDTSAVIDTISTGTEWISQDSEKSARSWDVGDAEGGFDEDEQVAGRLIEVFECYTKLDIDEKDGGSARANRKMWKIVMAGGEVLEKTLVKRAPFLVFVPLPRSHTMWGSSFAHRLVATQNAKTALTRGILDNVVQSTNPRWQVVRGGLPQPSELMEGRVGGIVNVKSLDSVAPLASLPLNPFVFQTLGMLSDNKEEISGISRLSQGLNKDAISQQNSQGMVEQLVSMSQVRQKVIARRFAQHFLAPLYMEILQLLVENAKKEFFIELAGNYVPVDPSALKVRKHVAVNFALGYGEQDREAIKYVNTFQQLNAAAQTDPALAQSFGAKQKHTVLSRALLASGIKDVSAILPDPSTLPPPPPNPMQQAELQKVQADIAQQQSQAQATAAKIQREEQRDAMQHQIEMAKMNIELTKIQSELQLKAREQAHKEQIDEAELKLATIAAAQNGAKTTAIVSTPKG